MVTKAQARAARRKAHLAGYGITPEEFAAQVKAQDGRCAICLRPFGRVNPAFDHDHSHCQKGCRDCWRGVLCKRCNLYLLGWVLQETRLGREHALMILSRARDYVIDGGVRERQG